MTENKNNTIFDYNSINKFITELQNSSGSITSTQLLQAGLNMIMMAERNAHLENNPTDKGNGSYLRKLGTSTGQVELIVPRDRDGDFRPSVLPKQYNRDFAERENLIMDLVINGYSPNQIHKTLTSMNLHYNPEVLEI